MEERPKRNPFHAFTQLVGLEFVEIGKYIREASEGLKAKERDFNVRIAAITNHSAGIIKPGFLNAPPQLSPFILREMYNYEYKFFICYVVPH
jgi:hypothetical protein